MFKGLLALFLGLTAVMAHASDARYFDNSGRSDTLSGGARMITIETPKGQFKVWTKRTGNNPTIKVLLLHGGPGADHEYLEAFDSYFPGASIEYYYYDQLGSGFSDKPTDDSLWQIPRFVDEVEQVRKALGLDKNNFYLFGHSWGGLLAIEYALKYPQNLKGLVISNMMASVPAYNAYANHVLMPAMDQKKLAVVKTMEREGKTADPAYMQTLIPLHYEKHLLRMPFDQWPEPLARSFSHLNEQVYVLMQGPSELGASGRIEYWDRSKDLSRIRTPTLVIGATYDTMDPAYMRKMAAALPNGRFLLCPNGSHMAMYDDQKTYFGGLVAFLKDVDSAGHPPKR